MAAQTVIGFFDDQSEAQRAVEKLQSRGISRDNIDLSNSSTGKTSGTGSGSSHAVNPVSGSERDENSVRKTSDDRTVDREGRNTNKITDFFNNLFGGGDKDDADRYSRVAQHSKAIVTVHAQSKEEAENAADILDDAGAIDVDERSSKLGYSGSRSAETRSTLSTPGSEGSGSSLRQRSRIVDRSLESNARLGEGYLDDQSNQLNRQAGNDTDKNEDTERSDLSGRNSGY